MKELLERLKNNLPKYTINQPSTGKTIVYRPFTVKEEKNLLMATSTGSHEDFLITLTDIINNCFNLEVDSKKLPLFDIEYFFIKLRCKSVGEIVEPIITCPITKEKIKLILNLETIEPIIDSKHTRKIDLGSSILVTMKYPSIEGMIENKENANDYYDILLNCIFSIETDKELILASEQSKSNLSDFIDLLTDEQYRKLINFLKTMPRIEHTVPYVTSDGVQRKLTLKGIKDFFQ